MEQGHGVAIFYSKCYTLKRGIRSREVRTREEGKNDGRIAFISDRA